MMPLNVAGIGMVSALGIGARFNGAAMRCGYNGFITTDSFEIDNENLVIAKAPLDDHLRGQQRLLVMMQLAINEALTTLPASEPIGIIACLGDKQTTEQGQILLEQLLDQLTTSAQGQQIVREQVFGYRSGRATFAHAVKTAQEQLASTNHRYVLVIAVDSLLQQQQINHYDAMNRLLTNDNTDGFIPGEAAVALLLTQEHSAVTTEIIGVGFGDEPGTIESDKPLTAQGLTQAVNQCAEDAGIKISATDFRISSASGESYFFQELSMVHGRTLDERKNTHPLWHPADHIGEVGAASGAAMVVMAHYAFQKGYAPGNTAICHISNDNSERAAFMLRYQEAVANDQQPAPNQKENAS